MGKLQNQQKKQVEQAEEVDAEQRIEEVEQDGAAEEQGDSKEEVETDEKASVASEQQGTKDEDTSGQEDEQVVAQAVEKDAKQQSCHDQLREIGAFVLGKKDDLLCREHGFNRVECHILLEMCENQRKGKKYHLSDGSQALIAKYHKALKKAKKI